MTTTLSWRWGGFAALLADDRFAHAHMHLALAVLIGSSLGCFFYDRTVCQIVPYYLLAL